MIIRFWGGHRESDWNSYWRMNELMAQKDQLGAALEHFGIEEIDICPPRHARAPVTLHYFEIFLPKSHSPGDIQLVCDEIRNLTGRLTQPLAADTHEAFHAQVNERLLYERQVFQMWDEALPRFLLGVDFESGRHVRLRPAEPKKWRLVDHTVGGWDVDRRVTPALVLEPSNKGAQLLADLKRELSEWYQLYGRPSLDDILQYRGILNRYGVDCNENFRYGLTDGWFPIDIDPDANWNSSRELCTMRLPDQPGELLVDENNKPVGRHGAIFSFVGLTESYP
jgi:hypothetical protein